MPVFDAGQSIEALDWDFTTVRDWPKSLSNAKGTLREPSDSMIGAFLDDMKKMYTDVKSLGLENIEDLGENPDPMAVMRMLDSVTGDDYVKVMGKTAELFSGLCSGSPSTEMLLALPLRGRMAFFNWITEEVIRPEAGSGGGAQVVSLPPREATG